MRSIVSVQYYRSAAHIASKSFDHRLETYSTDSTFTASRARGFIARVGLRRAVGRRHT